MSLQIIHHPEPGQYLIFHEGDFLKITLNLSKNIAGQAYIRTDLYQPDVKKQEIIDKADKDVPRKFQEWGDFPMKRKNETTFELDIPLYTIGYFEAKAFFLEQGNPEPLWPEGDNLHIKVEPLNSFIGNSIYTAFVRLFIREESLNEIKNKTSSLAEAGGNHFNIIPKSGTFRNLQEKVHYIIETLGFDVIMLLPVHPVPTTYARMGIYGSPYASLDFMNVDPALAEFDETTTPLEQFEALIDEIHAHHARIFIDIPVDHTGWASQLQIHHPEYFEKDENGMFVSPGAWGVTWEDLSKLDYSKKGLWNYIARVFLFWCRRGIDGFRCDAGYMIPSKAWEYIIHAVRKEFPSTIFLLEGLGGHIETTESLLTEFNLNWGYSEMFQNFDQRQMEWYINTYNRISFKKGPLVNFSETHDNNRLAATSKEFSMLRNGLLALLSDTGTFGITCGVEWLAKEKIDVHRLTSIGWGSTINMVDYLKKLNNVLKIHPTFLPGASLKKMHVSHFNSIAYLRESVDKNHLLLVVANLSPKPNKVFIDKTIPNDIPGNHTDILTQNKHPFLLKDNHYELSLEPLQVLAFSNTAFAEELHDHDINQRISNLKSERMIKLQVIKYLKYYQLDINEQIIRKQVNDFKNHPVHFFYQNNQSRPAVILWRYPSDLKRHVVVPSGTPVLVFVPHYFRFRIICEDKIIENGEGFYIKEKHYVAIINPGTFDENFSNYLLYIERYDGKNTIKQTGNLFLSDAESLNHIQLKYSYQEIHQKTLLSALMTNHLSGYSLLRGRFGELLSKYDALLAANLNVTLPEDKHIMLRRIRGWSVYKGFSKEINAEYQKAFVHSKNTVSYHFKIPAGGGCFIPLNISVQLDERDNKLHIKVIRTQAETNDEPNDNEPAKIIIRPDLESRNFHEVTKAYTGPEKYWPTYISEKEKGFSFNDNGKSLSLASDKGTFIREDEWLYMIHHPIDEERGMNKHGDLFSPGYFKWFLHQGQSVQMTAYAGLNDSSSGKQEHLSIGNPDDSISVNNEKLTVNASDPDENEKPQTGPRETHEAAIENLLKKSMDQFIVSRNLNKSVIAGYPWFIDWGRDTLISLRGIISAGFLSSSKSIIKEFATYEENGTIPNIIHGEDISNRDTSDAPLWLFVASRELASIESGALYEEQCGPRSLKTILKSIATNYMAGTPNGIKMDPESSLIYSPAHFTWMDTNYPACTPRQGYPVEIQALWHYAIDLLSELFPEEKQWMNLKKNIKKSVNQYFITSKSDIYSFDGKGRYLSDCLHSNKYVPAKQAVKDDHLRPNQLFIITLDVITDPGLCRDMLLACESLIVPGAIRSLADLKYQFSLNIPGVSTSVLDPENPYQGEYTGDEDASRKPAYHNGTAWTWPFPSYVEALVKVYGKNAFQNGKDILASSFKLLNEGCMGQIPEITDGNFPHTQKGCYAQAWGITEFYRVYQYINLLK